jgi:hypothetical protein
MTAFKNLGTRPDRSSVALAIIGVTFACLLGLALVLYRVDPATVSWLPKCPLHQLTGWHCPGCGITRAAHALLHGDISGAFAKNPLLVAAAPLLVAYSIWKRRQEGPRWTNTISAKAVVGFLIVLLVFAVLRNIPGYPFELLAPH